MSSPRITASAVDSSSSSPTATRAALTTPFVPSGCEGGQFTTVTGVPYHTTDTFVVSDPRRSSTCQPEGWDAGTPQFAYSPAVCPSRWTAYSLTVASVGDEFESRAICCSESFTYTNYVLNPLHSAQESAGVHEYQTDGGNVVSKISNERVHALTTRAIDRRADGYENLEGLENAEGGLCRFEMVTKHVAPGDVLGRSSAPYYRNSDDTQAVTPETIECLRSRGITHVISLNSQAHAEDIRQGLESAGIAYTASLWKTFTIQPRQTLHKAGKPFVSTVEARWCGVAMDTAVLLTHWSDAQYGENFVETPEQKQALNELEKSLKAKGPQGATPAPPSTDNRPQGVTPNPAEAMDVDADKSDEATQIERPQTGTSNPAEAMDVDTGSSNEPMDVDRPQGVTPNPPTAMDVDRPQGATPNPPTAMDVDTANSQEPMEVDEEILTRWRQGQFGTVNCVAAIAALTALSNNKLGRSLSKPSLGARAQEDDCSRAREMALKAKAPAAPSTGSCSKVSTLDFGFQLKDNNWAGTYDSISVAFASEEDKKSKNGQHQQVEIARAPSAGLHVWKPIDLKKFFGASSVALRDIYGAPLMPHFAKLRFSTYYYAKRLNNHLDDVN
ncbi:tyrosine phosphatase [Cordyceps militaris]|uniref:Tyrosine phosphatase n=1 Tax=Cordyceps militaris TaxID=73501 RepID=A0A2H4SR64_CORMI|nr:tyrosine phosphatase [Cordyceps militaris]